LLQCFNQGYDKNALLEQVENVVGVAGSQFVSMPTSKELVDNVTDLVGGLTI
jgi:hypothetical protein